MKSVLLAALMAAGAWAADELPEWVRTAAAQPVPSYSNKVSTVVLFHEEAVTVDRSGSRTMRERKAIRILQRGASLTAFRAYNTKTGRIHDFRGWLLPPTGKATPYGKDRIVDVALSRNYTYDEERAQALEAGAGTTPGSVFAYEITEEEKSVFTQHHFEFQGREPVLLSRFVLSLPAGWEARGVVFNRDRFDPQVTAGTYTWEIRNLPWIEDENYSPDLSAVVPRLGVTFFPAGDSAAQLRPLKDWPAVSAWLGGFAEPPAAISEPVRRKGIELTAAAAGELDKIRAIAAFAQQTNYVSVQMNTTRGGGYTPHRAEDVLARNYGDCKDKSTLMRALLSAAGISSYLTVIYSSDRQFVRPDWPSPLQFDHAIVAVRVSSATDLPSVLNHPRLGRLLFFDPTDYATPLGDLPKDEQGSHALVIAGTQGELVEIPMLPADSSRIESTVEATVNPQGVLEAHMTRRYFGQSASPMRAFTARRDETDLRRRYERILTRRLGGVTLKQIDTTGGPTDNPIQVKIEFGAEHFFQAVQGIVIMKPGALALATDYALPPGERALPVKLTAEMYRDSVRIQIPPGYNVDEMPEPARIESPYGSYQAAWKSESGALTFDQSLTIRELSVPPAEYEKLREFFERLSGNQSAPVVLAKR